METPIECLSEHRTQWQTGTYALASGLFLRGLALAHAAAFGSAWMQIPGLIGPHGLLPAGRLFTAAREQLGSAAYLRVPSLGWAFGAWPFPHVLCAAGLVLSALLFFGIAPAPCLAALWACFLSLATEGQTFFDFQWDALLLETTLIAVFLAPWTLFPGWRPAEPPKVARWLIGWLLFRLMFLSGIVKLASGDPTWRHLTALDYHYWTQPLPTPVAWYAARLPGWFQRFSCGTMFAIELVAPFCIFAPRAVRHPAAASIIGFQAAIALTGNYAFFNLLTVALCVVCIDDAGWQAFGSRLGLRSAGASAPETKPSAGARMRTGLLRAFAVFYISCTSIEAAAEFVPQVSDSAAFGRLSGILAPFRSVNNYGLFAVMTTERPELIIEGSDDGLEWRAYDLPHKPGDLARRPDFVAPGQPRLDWQLWFAALGTPDQNPWIDTLCERLLRGSPEVLALVARNPFPGHPPRYVRIVRYDYEFTDAAERKRNGNWWRRTPVDFYVRPVSLRADGRLDGSF